MPALPRPLRFLPEARRDGTTYSRFHPANFLSHHLADIVTAAVYADARHIADNIVLLKSRALGAATAAADASAI